MHDDDVTTAKLFDLARRSGVEPTYVGWDRHDHEVSPDTLVPILHALGVRADGPEEIDASLRAADELPWRRFVPPVTVVTSGGAPSTFWVHVPHGDPVEVSITAESGEVRTPDQLDVWFDPREIDGALVGRATFAIPADLECGYHKIKALNTRDSSTAKGSLIVTPHRLETADELTGQQRWGLAAQLYSIRSAQSWGVGDLADLGRICEIAAEVHGADFVLVNPLHAAAPRPPLEPSPYLPTSRRFRNPLYLRIEDIPEAAGLSKKKRAKLRAAAQGFADANVATDRIKRNKSFRAKLTALESIHALGLSDERAAEYREFRRREGKGLRRFAAWCAFAERYDENDPKWTNQLCDKEFVKRKRRRLARRIDFFTWLQWLCDEQLAAAQRRATTAGMDIGVIADLAVGVARHSADTWALGDVLADGVSAGAPPDGFNQQGQDWQQPPWHPGALADVAYRPYRDMLRTVLRNVGGLRVDHILGLFRLWWIPDGMTAEQGAYVRYDHDAMLGILALEAQRAGAVVIGEDLGVFESSVRDLLRERGILGTSILWFEHGDIAPIPPEDYRELCLTAVTTHDLPPTLGYLAGDHLELRERLGLLTGTAADERVRDERDRDAILDLARSRGLLPDTADNPDTPDASDTEDSHLAADGTVDALYALIARSPSVLLGVALVDAVGERRIQNQPGTDGSRYPNWCIPLADADGKPVQVEDLATHARFVELVRALRSGSSADV